MTEARVGRLLAACLHQAIADILPQRLDFYEPWLRAKGWRDGSLGLAPMLAVTSFLRTEGDAYNRVMTRAGSLAAQWTVESLSPFKRRMIPRLPRWWRARAALRVAADTVRVICTTSRAATRVKRHEARLDVKASLFCSVREPHALPLCEFYRAVAQETLTQLGVQARANVDACRAVSGETCVVKLDLQESEPAATPARAA